MGNRDRNHGAPDALAVKPAVPGGAGPAVTCGNCRCFQPPPARPGADATALAAMGMDRGTCLRFPRPELKAVTDHCFEFIAKEGIHA